MGRLFYIVPASLLMLAACGAERTETSGQATLSELPAPAQAGDEGFSKPGRGIAVVNGSEAASIDIQLPKSIDSLPPKLADTIRERASAGTEAFVESAEADRTASEEDDYEFRPHTLDVVWIETGPADGRLAAFLGTYASYSGGAHPNVGFDMLNWDREADTIIAFEDLFDDVEAARATVSQELKSGILKSKRERLKGMKIDEQEMMDTWVGPAFEGNGVVFDGFTIARSSEDAKAGGLIYHFAPYEVGAYAEGIYEVGVGYEHFADLLSPAYADSFGGQPILP